MQRIAIAAAWLLVVTFAYVPALSRVHDHLSTADQSAGFKLSKNVDRPHEKQVASATTAVSPSATDEGAGPFERLLPAAAPAFDSRSPAARPLRAPPAR